MVRSYINDEIEIDRFKERIYESNKLINYHNKMIKELRNTIEKYNQIINDLEINEIIETFK